MSPLPVDQFQDYLTVLARARLGPRLRQRVSVSDVVQETLLEAHRSLENFRGESARQQAAWLRRILVTQIARAYRHHRFEKRDLERERSLEASLELSSSRFEGWLAAEQSTPSGKVARGEELLRVASALASIPEDQQDALVLHYCEEMSLEAIGEELDVSRHTAGRLVRRGLATLRQQLGSPGT